MKKLFVLLLSYTEIWWICIDCNHEQKRSDKCEKCGSEFLTKGEDGGHE
jgi:primosomal protein N'